MNNYIVLYRAEEIMSPFDPPFGFGCEADDADHAEEQCLNAYPDSGVVWVIEGDDYIDALAQYYKENEVIL